MYIIVFQQKPAIQWVIYAYKYGITTCTHPALMIRGAAIKGNGIQFLASENKMFTVLMAPFIQKPFLCMCLWPCGCVGEDINIKIDTYE